jgi:hypothetical protein
MLSILGAIRATIELVLRIWGWVSGRSKQRLQNKRIVLEEQNRQAQLDGDLDALRKTRAEIEEVDRRLLSGDY